MHAEVCVYLLVCVMCMCMCLPTKYVCRGVCAYFLICVCALPCTCVRVHQCGFCLPFCACVSNGVGPCVGGGKAPVWRGKAPVWRGKGPCVGGGKAPVLEGEGPCVGGGKAPVSEEEGPCLLCPPFWVRDPKLALLNSLVFGGVHIGQKGMPFRSAQIA